MRRIRSAWRSAPLLLVLVAWGSFGGASLVAQAPPPAAPPAAAQDGFVPIDQLPPEEKLPAAPLVIAAYAVAWLAVAGYLYSIWRRLDRVDRDLADLERRVPRG